MFSFFIKDILPGLYDPSNPYTSQHKYVLVSLTDVKSILLVAEIHGADDLMLRLFNSTFDGVSNNAKAASDMQIAKDVEIHLTDMLVQLIDESPGSVPASVVDAIISQFLRAAPPGGARSRDQNDSQSTLLHKTEPPAYVMAKNICNACADKMSRYVSQYFSDVILNASGFATKANGFRNGDASDDEDAASGPSEADLKSLGQAHTLIRELWRAAPDVLQNVVPQIEAELSADNVHLRSIATETFGYMISGIGAAGPPPPPSLDPTAYPPLRLEEEGIATPPDASILTTPFSPHSFAAAHHGTYRNFVGRKNDKNPTIRAAWATAVGYIVSTSAGGIGLSREDERELIQGLGDKLNDSDEKVRLAAVKAIELFTFRDLILKLGISGGVQKEGSVFASLADRCRDRRPAIRVAAMVLLGKLWAVGSGEIAAGHESVTSCLSGVPSRIINAFYANDPDLNVLLDRVMFECLVPLRYPLQKKKGGKNAGSQAKGGLTHADQDRIRAERILLMLKSLDAPAQKAFFAMQARQPAFAKGASVFIQQCEAYNGGVIDRNEEKVKASLSKTIQWLGGSFPDPLKVRSDLQKFAKHNDRRSYQLFNHAIGADADFLTVRRAIMELIQKLQAGSAASSLDTIIPLLYRSSCIVFNRSHLATIMDYSKSDKGGYATVAHAVLNDISQRNPDMFKAHSEELRKEIIDNAPSDSKANDASVADILKAYSSYAKRYPKDINHDKAFTQTLVNYALYGAPPKAAKYAINILLAKNDDKGRVTATNVLQKTMKGLKYGCPHFLNRLVTLSQLERLAPTVTVDSAADVHDLTIKQILREVRTEAASTDPSWVEDLDMDEELQAKLLCLRILVNQALANADEKDAEETVKPVFKLLKTLVVAEGEFCKTKQTPEHHKKRLRLLAGQLILKLCTNKKYDDLFDPAGFNKLAELIQDSEQQVRRRFMERLQNYLTRGRLRARFYTMLFLVAFEPVTELKNRVETWIRSRVRYHAESKKYVMEAIIGRLIPLLAHHPDYSASPDDLVDFANYFLFFLNATATEENISLIYKYAERVKQTRDALTPEASDNLYVLSDLAQSVVRKYQERRNWIFQAWSEKVGLPTGLYAALPSSEMAQEVAKKQYMPEEVDGKLDDLIRAMERKKVKSRRSWPQGLIVNLSQKRKSYHEPGDQAAKRIKTQTKIASRPKSAASGTKKPKKAKAATKRRKSPSSPAVPLSERRRSGRAHNVSAYTERNDEEDEEEMLEGVAEWTYGDGSDESGDEEASEASGSEEGSAGNENEEEEDEATAPAGRNGRGSTAAKAKAKPAVKGSVVEQLKSGTRSSRRRGKPADSDSDVDMD